MLDRLPQRFQLLGRSYSRARDLATAGSELNGPPVQVAFHTSLFTSMVCLGGNVPGSVCCRLYGSIILRSPPQNCLSMSLATRLFLQKHTRGKLHNFFMFCQALHHRHRLSLALRRRLQLVSSNGRSCSGQQLWPQNCRLLAAAIQHCRRFCISPSLLTAF